MAKILFLTHRLPYPPDRGDRIRSFHFLRYLAVRPAVSLAAVTDHPIDETQLGTLRQMCQSVDVGYLPRWARAAALRYVLTATPLTLPAFFSRSLQTRIAHRLASESFDVIFIYSSSMAPYVLSRTSVPKVIDFIDADSEKWFAYARRAQWPLKFVYLREGHLLRRYERRVAQTCTHAVVTSDQEAVILRPLVGTTPITPIPNGAVVRQVDRSARRPLQLVFTGVMDYWPNVDAMTYFAYEILPRIRARIPDVTMVIVGQRPAPRIQRLARLEGVTVTGRVPNVSPYLQSATAFVAPLRTARGMSNKVLEAMAIGLPVVATSAAVAGLRAVPGRHVVLADGPEEFAAQTVSLLLDQDRQERLSCAALEYVREEHSWDTHAGRLESLLMDVIKRPSARATASPRQGAERQQVP